MCIARVPGSSYEKFVSPPPCPLASQTDEVLLAWSIPLLFFDLTAILEITSIFTRITYSCAAFSSAPALLVILPEEIPMALDSVDEIEVNFIVFRLILFKSPFNDYFLLNPTFVFLVLNLFRLQRVM